ARRPIIAFASAHGGVGTSLASVHVAAFAAARSSGGVIAVDLDLDAQDLDRLLAGMGAASQPVGRGVYGLLLDHHDRGLSGASFDAALRAALRSGDEAGSCGGLRWLPAGDLAPQERERARRLLQEETARIRNEGPQMKGPSFFLELGRSLRESAELVFIDTPPAVRDPFAAYFGAVLLADSMVLMVRPFASDEVSLHAMIRAFFSEDPLLRHRAGTGLLPVLSRLDMASEDEALDWYMHEIEPVRAARSAGPLAAGSPPVRLYENGRLSRGAVLANLHVEGPPHTAVYNSYSSIVEWVALDAKRRDLRDMAIRYFARDTPQDDRKIAMGALKNASIEHMPWVVSLPAQLFADENHPKLEVLRRELIEAWKRTTSLLGRGKTPDPGLSRRPRPSTLPPPDRPQ
ncbi:MAG: hypothetical protein R3B70_48080, partial [Polyangiaceae bacterium]